MRLRQASNLAGVWLQVMSQQLPSASSSSSMTHQLLAHALSDAFPGPMDMALLPLSILGDVDRRMWGSTGRERVMTSAYADLAIMSEQLLAGLSLQVRDLPMHACIDDISLRE